MGKVAVAIMLGAFGIALVISTAAQAEELSNVKNFDPALLIDKTCKGSWTDGKARLGATIMRFSKKDNALIATTSRRSGKGAFDGQEFDKPFEDLGLVLKLNVDGSTVSYTTSVNTASTYTYSDGRLVGKLDDARRPNTLNIDVSLTCS